MDKSYWLSYESLPYWLQSDLHMLSLNYKHNDHAHIQYSTLTRKQTTHAAHYELQFMSDSRQLHFQDITIETQHASLKWCTERSLKMSSSFSEKNREMGISKLPTCVHGTAGYMHCPVWDDNHRGNEQTWHRW